MVWDWLSVSLGLCKSFNQEAALPANRLTAAVQRRFAPPPSTVALLSAIFKENQMADDVKKDQGQSPGQPGQQSGQQQKYEDPSKKNPAQDRNQEQDDHQKRQDQGGQRRAS